MQSPSRTTTYISTSSRLDPDLELCRSESASGSSAMTHFWPVCIRTTAERRRCPAMNFSAASSVLNEPKTVSPSTTISGCGARITCCLKCPANIRNKEEAEGIPALNPDREFTRVDLRISVKGYSPDPTALELNAPSTRESAARVKIRG